MIVVSYYTKRYEKIISEYLIPSLTGLEVPYYTEQVKELGSWRKNTDYKPIFIKNCLEKFKNDIAFIDADAIVNKFPTLFWVIPKEYDIGVHYMDDKLYIPNGHRITVLSGTLFFRYNNKVKRLVNMWIKKSEVYHPDQRALDEAIKSSSQINVYKLPRHYCYIKTLANGKEPCVIDKNPTITHFQKSREMRRK